MTASRVIVKNMLVLFLSDAVTNVLSLVLAFAIARYLGAAGLGQFSFAISFASLFIIFSEFGTLTFLIKEVAKDKSKAKEYVANLTFLKLAFGIFTLALSVVAIFFSGQPDSVVRLVIVASIAMFFNYFGYLFRAIFQAYEVMEYDALTKFIERIAAVGLGLFVIAYGLGLEMLMVSQLAAYFLFFVASWFIASKKVIPVTIKFDIEKCKKIIHSSLPFWLTGIFIFIYFRIDTVMLTFMRSYQEVGWFSASFKFIEAIMYLPTVILVAVFPAFSKFHSEKNIEHLDLLFQKASYYMSVISLPIVVGGILVSGKIISFVYGPGFEPAIDALKILLIALLFSFNYHLMGWFLNATDRGFQFTMVAGLAALFNIVLNLFIIPKYGFIGAAWSSVLTSILIFILFFFLVSKQGISFPLLKLARPIASTVLMGLTASFLLSYHLAIIVAASAIVYFGSLFIIGGFEKDELDALKKTLGAR